MNVSGAAANQIMTALMAKQIQQLAAIQKMMAETAERLTQVLSNPSLGNHIDVQA